MSRARFSTVMNILLRYALEDGLEVVLSPSSHALYKSLHPRYLNTIMPEWHRDYATRRKYDVFLMHAKFNVEAIR